MALGKEEFSAWTGQPSECPLKVGYECFVLLKFKGNRKLGACFYYDVFGDENGICKNNSYLHFFSSKLLEGYM